MLLKWHVKKKEINLHIYALYMLVCWFRKHQFQIAVPAKIKLIGIWLFSEITVVYFCLELHTVICSLNKSPY